MSTPGAALLGLGLLVVLAGAGAAASAQAKQPSVCEPSISGPSVSGPSASGEGTPKAASPADYTGADSAAPGLSRAASLAASCSGCHWPGQTHLTDLTSLDGATIADLLKAYKADDDGTTVMHRLARGYSEAEIEAIAAYLEASRAGPASIAIPSTSEEP